MIVNILKNIFLLIAALIALLVLFIKNSYTSAVFYSTLIFSVLYIVFHIMYFIKEKNKYIVDENRYPYFTLGFVTKRIIFIGAAIIVSGVLFFSGNKVFLFGILTTTLLLAEVLGLVFMLSNHFLFIELKDNKIFISETKTNILPAHIKDIDFRHEIFYITLKNNKTHLIELNRFQSSKIENFKKSFVNWIHQNNLPFGEGLKFIS
jgi:hypothetical protein